MRKIKLKHLNNINKLLINNNIDIIKAEVGEVYIKIEKNGPLMKFVLEKISNDEIAFGFFGLQNGDVMADPELIFKIEEIEKLNKKKEIVKEIYLTPISFKNDYCGAYSECFTYDDNFEIIGFYPSRIKGVIDLAKNINLNLKNRI